MTEWELRVQEVEKILGNSRGLFEKGKLDQLKYNMESILAVIGSEVAVVKANMQRLVRENGDGTSHKD